MGRVPDDVVDQIREGLPIEQVIGEYVPLRKAGTAFKGICPFHDEKTPSFHVNPRMGIFKCFGCGAGGDVLRFLMRHEGLTFREALGLLAKRQGIDLAPYEGGAGEAGRPSARERVLATNRFAAQFYREALRGPEGARAREYLSGRGVGPEAEEAFRIGCAPARWDALCRAARSRGVSPEDLVEAGLALRRENGSGHYDRFRDRVMFPILSPEGEVLGFGGRSLPEGDSRHGGAKYVNTPDTAAFKKGRVLYGLFQAREAIRAERRALLTEGYFDVISLWQGGFRAAVAPLGTALTAEHMRILRAHAEEIAFVFDPDQAGQAASERAAGVAGRLLGLAGAPDALVAGDVLRREFIDREGLGAVRLKVVDLPRGRDVDDLMREEGPGAFAALLEGALGLLDHTVRAALGEVGAGADQAQKVAAIGRLLPVLGACHPSVRDQYFALLEDRIGIPYPTLSSMVRRMLAEEAREGAPRRGEAADLLGRAAERPRPEVDAVRILLARPELAGAPEVNPAAFADPALRAIVGALRAAAEAGRPLRPAALAERLEDPAAQALAVELAVEDLSPEEAERDFSDCMARLEDRLLRRRGEEIDKEIERVRRIEGTDSPMIKRLSEEKGALQHKRIRVTPAPWEALGL